MSEKKFEWMVSGNLVEGCNSPPVCPAYWGSPLPTDLHEGRSECEGVFSFNIREGYDGNVDLSGLVVSCPFNIPAPFPPPQRLPWKCVIYIDQKANARQAEALEKIFRAAWSRMAEVVKVKRAPISFTKELVNGGPAARHTVEIKGVYRLKSEPLLTRNGQPRYFNSMLGGLINIGKSEVNECKDPDLPRSWNRPGMSTTYFDFTLNPGKLYWSV